MHANQASSINPEAGSYPITSDPRELEAALSAAQRCLVEIPYLDSRYGERGRRFSHSDGGWLVTLVEHPEAATHQVFWLGQVLAARGMPRIILERHIELLCQELRQAVPDKDYSPLEQAGQALRSERLGQISEERTRELAQGFGGDPSMATLLVAAVADEKAGVQRSVESLMEWLTEADLRAEAEALLTRARS